MWLNKEWQDPEDGIEMVILHWACTRLGRAPDWRKTQQSVVMIPLPAPSPLRRRCTIWIPSLASHRRLLEAERQHGGFLLHSFFEVIQRGRTWNSEVSTQEICAATITHTDPSSEGTDAYLYYSLDSLDNVTQVQRVPMRLEGLPAEYQLLSVLPDGMLNAKDSQMYLRRSQLIARLPRPHTFHAWIWGPTGSRAFYTVYFNRQGAYNPFSEGGFWLLNDGKPWEVEL